MGTRSLKSRVLFVEVAIALFFPDDQVAAGLAPRREYHVGHRMLLHHYRHRRGFAPCVVTAHARGVSRRNARHNE